MTIHLHAARLRARNTVKASGAHLLTDVSAEPDSLYKKCIVLTNQSASEIDIINVNTQKLVWSWRPTDSKIPKQHLKWFTYPDDAKPVYNRKYLLMNASGGAVALIRIADKKVVFYTHAGKNPHSSELLPDGNIVTASSTDNRLIVMHTDTTEKNRQPYKKVIPLPFAHNVVWDKKRSVLWSAGKNVLYKLKYNQDKLRPDLQVTDSILLPDTQAHDLFPVYQKDALWITLQTGVYCINLSSLQITPATFSRTKHIKSVSSGPKKWPVIIMQPKISWWSDEVLDSQGNTVFKQKGMKIYKARWLLPNSFSY